MAQNILIVDDSSSIRKLVGLTLEFKEYAIVSAENGKLAWDILQKDRFDLIIIDILMPVMDGFTLLTKIKSNVKLKKTPCLILTTEGDEISRLKGEELGADSYMAKPFQPTQLIGKVEELLS